MPRIRGIRGFRINPNRGIPRGVLRRRAMYAKEARIAALNARIEAASKQRNSNDLQAGDDIGEA